MISMEIESNQKNKDKKNKRRSFRLNSSIVGMAQERINQLHGEGMSQIIQVDKGVRFDSFGNQLKYKGRSLKGISEYKVNPEYKEQNYKQQAGFSAELIKEARDNKEAIKLGKKTRVRTSDDALSTNHTVYDLIQIDGQGNVIEGTGSQMKFLKSDLNKEDKEIFNVLENMVKDKKWDRYDKVEVPQEQYEGILKSADENAKSLREQGQRLLKDNKTDQAQKKFERADRYEEAKNRVVKSNLTTEEALLARKNRKLFIAKEIVKDSHQAGVEAAKGALILSGAVSTSQNIFQVLYNEKEIEEAVKDVGETVIKSGAMAYGIGLSGSLIKTGMHTAKNESIRRLGTTTVPTLIATSTVEVTKSLKRYAEGKIDEVELINELGEKGTGMLSAGYGAAAGGVIGTAIFPGVGTAVGSFVGSTLGYTVSTILYQGVLETLENERISSERRKTLEALSNQSVIYISTIRKELLEYADASYQGRSQEINQLLEQLNNNIIVNNVNGIFDTINNLGDSIGIELQFNTFEEFDNFMRDESSVFKF